ncbi:hypothetical protein ACO0LL_23400 [Undibacterium sp. TC4M20W]|uniref:hypothetical protein n=1 Tax=unclassified Undibacterium TaxID=2630295 RepID=UPI003BF0FCA8
MLIFKRFAAIASIIFLGNFYPAVVFAKTSQEQLLVGKWVHSYQIQTDDGRVIPQKKAPAESTAIKATGEFFADNTWVLNGSKVKSSGTYRWVDGEHIEQKVLESNVAIQVGMLSVKRIKVSENRLEFIVAHDRAEMERYRGPAKPGQKRPNETIITTVFTRVGTAHP